ncbi:MAG: hypothetical protein ACKV1O_03465 [Saprospiraceae bacterium]
MDVTALTLLAKKVYAFVKPVFTNEVAGEIIGDFKEATKGSMRELWAKIKPWFIIDEKETDELKKVKEKPEQEIYDEAFVSRLRVLLHENPEMQKELEAMLTKIENGDDEKAKIIITNSRNVNTGNISNVTGGVRIGDNFNTPGQ